MPKGDSKGKKLARIAGKPRNGGYGLATNKSYYPYIRETARKEKAKSGAKPKAASKLKK